MLVITVSDQNLDWDLNHELFILKLIKIIKIKNAHKNPTFKIHTHSQLKDNKRKKKPTLHHQHLKTLKSHGNDPLQFLKIPSQNS